MITLEACCNSVQSAVEAQKGGAKRVELCNNLPEGGTTPPFSHIQRTRKLIDIQLYTLIRPRGGDFCYSNIEFDTMKQDIHHCGQAKCNGVVIGILNPDGTVDKKRSAELIEIAKSYGMGVTFHRAFDRTKDLFAALEDVIDLGCERILTSGGTESAIQAKDTLKDLIIKSNGQSIIMPGSGITEENIFELVMATGLKEFHGSFQSRYKGEMAFHSPQFPNLNEEYTYLQTDSRRIKQAIENANKGYKA